MTDGVITVGKGMADNEGGVDELYDYIAELDANGENDPWDATIFTFSLGTPAAGEDLKTVPHTIACNHNGLWVAITDSAEKGALKSAMSGYYAYIANGIVTDKVVWSEEYEDS